MHIYIDSNWDKDQDINEDLLGGQELLNNLI